MITHNPSPPSPKMAIGISPEKLELNLQKNETLTPNIFIQNLDTKEQTVTVQASKFENLIAVNPSKIILLPQEIKPVEIMVMGKKSFSTELEIKTLAAMSEDLSIQSGVKIPLSVKVANELNYLPLIGILVLILTTIAARRFIGKTKA